MIAGNHTPDLNNCKMPKQATKDDEPAVVPDKETTPVPPPRRLPKPPAPTEEPDGIPCEPGECPF